MSNEHDERTESEKREMEEMFKKSGVVDWNKKSLDEMVDYLDRKWMLSSTGEARCIFELIDFYRKNKDKV